MNPEKRIQKPILFKRGNATSLDPMWYGIKKFAKNPKIIGITTKKIIIRPWLVITCKYFMESPLKKWLPGYDNSNLINVAKKVPDKPLKKLKYR